MTAEQLEKMARVAHYEDLVIQAKDELVLHLQEDHGCEVPANGEYTIERMREVHASCHEWEGRKVI